MPDVVARYNMSGDWGSFTVAGILRELRHENAAAGIDDSTGSYGITLNTANGAVLNQAGELHAIDSTGVFGSFHTSGPKPCAAT